MSKEFPLFPELPEDGQNEAVKLIEKFKEELKKAANDAIGDLYCEIIPHIESDSWTNYRNFLMDGLQHYPNKRIQGTHDFKKIRQSILKEFRNDLIPDLNQDMAEEIESLKEQLKNEREFSRNQY